MSNIEFNSTKHEYKVDGTVFASVTQILDSTGFYDFSKVNPEVLKRNAEFGKAVHKAIELKSKRKLDDSSVADEIRPYLASWESFVSDFDYEYEESEIIGFCDKYRFCYTFDQKGSIKISKYKVKVKCLIDIKTGQPKGADKVQINGGYALAVDKNIVTGILYLNPEFKPSGYKILFSTNNKRDQSIFLSALTVHNYKKENGLL
jgi:hypothetical protein